MILGEDQMPQWVGWLIGPSGLAVGGVFVWLLNEVRKSRATARSNALADEDRKRAKRLEDDKDERAKKIEDEARANQHVEYALASVKADNAELKKQISEMKSEMKEMQHESRRLAEVATANQMRADRFRMYCTYLEDLLTRNNVVFRRWTEDDDDSATHPALPSPGV